MKKVLIALSFFSILLYFRCTPVTFADTITISRNGAGSHNSVNTSNFSFSSFISTNVENITNIIFVNSNTGGNTVGNPPFCTSHPTDPSCHIAVPEFNGVQGIELLFVAGAMFFLYRKKYSPIRE